MAALTGFITAKELDKEVHVYIFYVMAFVALFAVIAALSLVIFNQREMKSLKRSCELMDDKIFDETGLVKLFIRVKVVGWLCATCCLLIAISNIYGLGCILNVANSTLKCITTKQP